jgi:cell division protein FtsB
MSETWQFEVFRVIALGLIYAMFCLQLWSARGTYRQFKRWAEEEHARRERWAQDMATIAKLREEAYHLREQAEIALAQARRHLPPPGVPEMRP